MRQSDGQLLGKSVSYIRPTQNTGDPIFHQAAHVCPKENVVAQMIAEVFSIKAN